MSAVNTRLLEDNDDHVNTDGVLEDSSLWIPEEDDTEECTVMLGIRRFCKLTALEVLQMDIVYGPSNQIQDDSQ